MLKKTLPLILLVSLFVSACGGGGDTVVTPTATTSVNCALGTSTLGDCKL